MAVRHRRSDGPGQTPGFTLIELLVVVSIIALLIAVLLPSLKKAQFVAKLVVCGSNQRQITAGVLAYSADHEGRFPPSVHLWSDGTSWTVPWYMNYHRTISKYGQGAVGTFLASYCTTAAAFICPLQPGAPTGMQISGKPATFDDCYRSGLPDLVNGSYYMLWSYDGFATQTPRDVNDKPIAGQKPFTGPWSQSSSTDELLLADGLSWGEPVGNLNFLSSHPLGDNSVAAYSYTKFWASFAASATGNVPDVKLNAAYRDGHVAQYPSLQSNWFTVKNGSYRYYLPQRNLR